MIFSMGEYLRFAAAALIGLILVLVVGRQSRDLGMLLSLAVCVLLALGAMEFLEPVMELLAELKRLVVENDPDAFIVVQEAHQVLGEGFGRYSKDSL